VRRLMALEPRLSLAYLSEVYLHEPTVSAIVKRFGASPLMDLADAIDVRMRADAKLAAVADDWLSLLRARITRPSRNASAVLRDLLDDHAFSYTIRSWLAPPTLVDARCDPARTDVPVPPRSRTSFP
jgi:hypothetical protein